MKRLTSLTTAVQVVEALGGLSGVCDITEANLKQAWHWHGRSGSFPAAYHEAMTRALKQRGYRAPPLLWNQMGRGLKKAPKRKRTKRAA